MVDSTDHDDLAALDFSASGTPPASDDADALDFSVAHSDDDDSSADALGEYAPAEPEEAGTELEALTEDTERAEEDSEEEARERVLEGLATTVTNPPGTVSVSALIDGSVHRVELTPKAVSMSESQLSDEILVLAHLARQKGLASQHTYLVDNELLASDAMREIGLDREVVRDFAENGMGLPTPQQAEAEQAEVFATRYSADNE